MNRFEPNMQSMFIVFVVITLALTLWNVAGREEEEAARGPKLENLQRGK